MVLFMRLEGVYLCGGTDSGYVGVGGLRNRAGHWMHPCIVDYGKKGDISHHILLLVR